MPRTRRIETECLELLKQFMAGNISRQEFDLQLAEITATLQAQQQLFEVAA